MGPHAHVEAFRRRSQLMRAEQTGDLVAGDVHIPCAQTAAAYARLGRCLWQSD